MRHYRLEPTDKKSAVEHTQYFKDGMVATCEEGYRWGQYIIHIPETEEEFEAWASKFGMSLEDADDNYYHIFSDDSIKDKYLEICGPDLGSDNFDMDDYHHDLIELWDCCWEHWYVEKVDLAEELTDKEEEGLIEHLQDLYEEGYNEAVEADGWVLKQAWSEIQCSVTLVPCDEDGYTAQELNNVGH
jgi:hypothetical protein